MSPAELSCHVSTCFLSLLPNSVPLGPRSPLFMSSFASGLQQDEKTLVQKCTSKQTSRKKQDARRMKRKVKRYEQRFGGEGGTVTEEAATSHFVCSNGWPPCGIWPQSLTANRTSRPEVQRGRVFGQCSAKAFQRAA